MKRLVRMKAACALAAAVAVLLPLQGIAEGSALEPEKPAAASPSLQAAFAPWDDVESLIVDTLAAARHQILVQAYLLTSKRIGAALIAAQRRGIDVKVLLDEEQCQRAGSALASKLSAAGVPVWLDRQYQNAHNKVMVIDAQTPSPVLITGSYNFTWTAQHRNAENILIVRDDPVIVARYTENWERHRDHSLPYKTCR